MTRPHGMPGKAYAPTIFILAAILLTLAALWIIIAPFRVVACIAVAIAVVLAGFIAWICITQPTCGPG
jgi:hypothetical protein